RADPAASTRARRRRPGPSTRAAFAVIAPLLLRTTAQEWVRLLTKGGRPRRGLRPVARVARLDGGSGRASPLSSSVSGGRLRILLSLADPALRGRVEAALADRHEVVTRRVPAPDLLVTDT